MHEEEGRTTATGRSKKDKRFHALLRQFKTYFSVILKLDTEKNQNSFAAWTIFTLTILMQRIWYQVKCLNVITHYDAFYLPYALQRSLSFTNLQAAAVRGTQHMQIVKVRITSAKVYWQNAE